MEYIGIGIIISLLISVSLILYLKNRKEKIISLDNLSSLKSKELKDYGDLIEGQEESKFVIEMEMIPASAIKDESKLVEIKDSTLLSQISNLIPGFVMNTIVTNNSIQGINTNNEVLYQAEIPSGAKLSSSKEIRGAFRGIYHSTNGIKGHANFKPVSAPKAASLAPNLIPIAMAVAAMVVGQYYMSKINGELREISDGISEIKDFQDNEFRSRVFSLIAHVKKIADFQSEILENEELRLSKIYQLDSLEEECTKLLGQANLMLVSFEKKTDLKYEAYEKSLGDIENWMMYQKTSLDLLNKISDLRYTLHLGAVSREQCVALLPTYEKQVKCAQGRLSAWHNETIQRLGIELDKLRRKRDGLDNAIHFIPGLLNDDKKFRTIENRTAEIIIGQVAGHISSHAVDTSELYTKDVQLIAKDGKVYYLPEVYS